jgi:hypothetical protein
LEEKEKPLVDVFFIRKFFGDHRKDFFDRSRPITVFPDDGPKLVKVRLEGILSFQHFAKGFPELPGELWDYHGHKAIVRVRPFEL